MTRSDINRPVQSQKMVRSLKFWIKEEEKLYYQSGENKGADQLCSYYSGFPMMQLICGHRKFKNEHWASEILTK